MSIHLLNAHRLQQFLGSVFQGLATLPIEKFFLITNLDLPWSNLRLFPHILSLVTSEKRSTPSSLQLHFRWLWKTMRSPLKLFFSRLNSLSSLSHSPCILFSSPFTKRTALLLFSALKQLNILHYLLVVRGPKLTQGVVSPALNTKRQSVL